MQPITDPRTPPRGAKKAALRYRYVGQANGNSIVHIDLETGRYHQIRVQLAAAGYPIVGDSKYDVGDGGNETHRASNSDSDRKPGRHSGASPDKVGLWNVRLKLNHPVGGAPLCLVRVPDIAF